MTTKATNGGPAFPGLYQATLTGPDGDGRIIVEQGGMSMRDWFAGQFAANAAMYQQWNEDRETNSSFSSLCLSEADLLLHLSQGGREG